MGVLNERLDPQRVGGKGLTACTNVIYHRDGTWGKRPGARQHAMPLGDQKTRVSNGIRWYRTFPTIVTQLAVWAQNELLMGNDPDGLAVVPGPWAQTDPTISPDFCSARDPQAANGNGADVLIVCGLTHDHGSFGTGNIVIVGNPPTDVTATITITVKQGATTVTTQTYNILPTDNPSSIASQLVTFLNSSSAYLNKSGFDPPFLGVSYYTTPQNGNAGAPHPQAIIHLGASNSGGNGNNITFGVTWGTGDQGPMQVNLNGSIVVPFDNTLHSTNFTGGGQTWNGPLRWDNGTGTLVGLSYMCPNPFTGCTSWHDHVWFWGDKGNPDTVFASDIYQPEAFTFMAENGGMNSPPNSSLNGGYTIGPGDGDPSIQACVANGNSLYLFKTQTIYQMTGYDFQQGEYQFSVTPQLVGYGIPSRDCVDVLEGQYVFWSGRKLLRLAVGAYEPEHIGMPIPLQEGLAANGNQTLVKVVAGDFQIQTDMTNEYVKGTGGPEQPILLHSVALFAVDTGGGMADTILVYDDEKTQTGQEYAWSVWSGWRVSSWIKYGSGLNPAGNQDAPLLFFVGNSGAYIYGAGAMAQQDWGNPIPWMAQTGWIDFTTPEMIKNIHEFYLRVEARAGANFFVQAIPARIVPAIGQTSQFPPQPVTFTFAPTLAPNNCEALNDLKSFIQAALQTQAVMLQFTEDGTAFAGFELVSYGIDCNPQEAYQT